METITTLSDYCTKVNIPQPKYDFFDIRRFEDKVKTENAKQEAFQHEFYAIALRHIGGNRSVNGAPLESNLFFNSPYQVISWNVLPDWKGWYIMFGQEFLALNPAWNHFIVDFPFFRLDQSIPLDLPSQDAVLADNFFQRIFEEYHSEYKDKFQFIQAYTSLLLHITKRYFINLAVSDDTHNNRTADILLVSRFQSLIEANAAGETLTGEVRRPAFYASKLHVHPNHLNAVVKRITGKTATTIIQSRFATLAKLFLKDGGLSVKEVAFRLHFKNTSHFNFFFKKATGFTPQQYQQQ